MRIDYTFHSLLILIALILPMQVTFGREHLGPMERLNEMVQQLQQNPADDALREKIIKLAHTLRPAPAVSREADRHLNRGTAAFKIAKSAADYKEAANEFQQAANLAPWWASAYFDIGMSEKEAGDIQTAISAYKFYLLAAPHAKDAKATQDLIDQLGYLADQQDKEQKELAVRQDWARDEVARLNAGYNSTVINALIATPNNSVSLGNPNAADWRYLLNDQQNNSENMSSQNWHFRLLAFGNDRDRVEIDIPFGGGRAYAHYCLDYKNRNPVHLNSSLDGFRVVDCADKNDIRDTWLSFAATNNGNPWIQLLSNCQNNSCNGSRYVLEK